MPLGCSAAVLLGQLEYGLAFQNQSPSKLLWSVSQTSPKAYRIPESNYRNALDWYIPWRYVI